jgi:hypothetical protein
MAFDRHSMQAVCVRMTAAQIRKELGRAQEGEGGLWKEGRGVVPAAGGSFCDFLENFLRSFHGNAGFTSGPLPKPPQSSRSSPTQNESWQTQSDFHATQLTQLSVSDAQSRQRVTGASSLVWSTLHSDTAFFFSSNHEFSFAKNQVTLCLLICILNLQPGHSTVLPRPQCCHGAEQLLAM